MRNLHSMVIYLKHIYLDFEHSFVKILKTLSYITFKFTDIFTLLISFYCISLFFSIPFSISLLECCKQITHRKILSHCKMYRGQVNRYCIYAPDILPSGRHYFFIFYLIFLRIRFRCTRRFVRFRK